MKQNWQQQKQNIEKKEIVFQQHTELLLFHLFPSRYPMFDIVYLTFVVSWDSQYKCMLLEDKLSTGTGKYNIESF